MRTKGFRRKPRSISVKRTGYAYIIDPAKLNRDESLAAGHVKVRDVDYDDEEEFTLVGAGDEDYDAGKILSTSPIGAALLGK